MNSGSCRRSAILQRLGRDFASGGRTNVRDEPLVARSVLAQHDGGFEDLLVVAQQRLDLAELDAIPADLDLVVDATQAFDPSRPAG